MGEMVFTKAVLKRLIASYDKAVKAGADQFNFEGQDLVTAYAEYLIEYLKGKFGK